VITANYFGRRMVLSAAKTAHHRLWITYWRALGASPRGRQGSSAATPSSALHAWRYGGDGKAVESHPKKIPKKACVESGWSGAERSGLIYMWHHPDPARRAEPEFGLRVASRSGGKGRRDSLAMSVSRFKTHPREIVDETVSETRRIFPKVTNPHVDLFENDPTARTPTAHPRRRLTPRASGGKDEFEITGHRTTYFGPGYQLSGMKGVLEARSPERAHAGDLENSISVACC